MIVFGINRILLGQTGCNRAKVVVFGQKWLYSGKVVVFGKSCIRLYSEKSNCFRAKWL